MTDKYNLVFIIDGVQRTYVDWTNFKELKKYVIKSLAKQGIAWQADDKLIRNGKVIGKYVKKYKTHIGGNE